MNYLRNYQEGIKYVQSLCRTLKDDCTYENHHIIPRSLGGTEDVTNKVLLTPREHYLAHYLLMRIYEGTPQYRSMVYAFFMMNWNKYGTRYVNSRMYASVKTRAAKVQSQFLQKGTSSREAWYSVWKANAVHIKDKNTKGYQDWEKATKAAIPQMRDPESPEYKEWYSRMMSGKPSSRDHSSPEYLAWHEKMMEGRKNKKMRWVNNGLRSRTIDESELSIFIAEGWSLGRIYTRSKN